MIKNQTKSLKHPSLFSWISSKLFAWQKDFIRFMASFFLSRAERRKRPPSSWLIKKGFGSVFAFHKQSPLHAISLFFCAFFLGFHPTSLKAKEDLYDKRLREGFEIEEKITTDFSEKYFSRRNSVLTQQDKAALDLAKRYEMRSLRPLAGKNGGIRYVFGSSTPVIVCAPLQVCDLALQVGEKVNSVNLGDTARWSVEPAITGEADHSIQHLVIKPMDVALETSLIVTTTRRTYHLRLRSHRNEYMPQVSFSYPEESLEKWKALRAREEQIARTNTLPETGERIETLFFGYTILGNAPWKPVRIYDDGQKTIIDMPPSMKNREAPILLVLQRNRGKSSGSGDMIMVNYRLIGTRFIVDSLFEEAILMAGVGKAQNRIILRRTKKV